MFDFAEATKEMTAEETLNYYRNLYYAEPQVTERGIVANAINDYLQEAAPRAEVAREILQEVRQAVMSLVIANAMGENFDLEKRFSEIEKKYTEAEPPKTKMKGTRK